MNESREKFSRSPTYHVHTYIRTQPESGGCGSADEGDEAVSKSRIPHPALRITKSYQSDSFTGS